MLKKIEEVLALKRESKTVEPAKWRQVARFLEKSDKGWEKKLSDIDMATKLCGCFAIRTNCIDNPALEIYRNRNAVEVHFRVFKDIVNGRRMFCQEGSYLGKLFVFTLAESLNMSQLFTMKENAKKLGVPRPKDSMETAMLILSRLCARKSKRSGSWKTRHVYKKARDVLALLRITKIPEYLH